MRTFNTAGPIRTDEHYHVPLLQRVDLQQVLTMIRQSRYFVMHAPRQTGKTSTLLALRDLLNAGDVGDFRCVYVNVESAQAANEDVDGAIRAVLSDIALEARVTLDDTFLGSTVSDNIERVGALSAIKETLVLWAENSAQPLVLLIDEIDALVGASLLSVLRQLRAGYTMRPKRFPQSIVLCGVRDIRDYRIQSKEDVNPVAGGSAFNISVRSLRLRDFNKSEVASLLEQHTIETGQLISSEAKELIWNQTRGQPWLVNALAAWSVEKTDFNSQHTIEAEDVQQSQEELILSRTVHLDQLGDKLQEPRVRRVIEPILSGTEISNWNQSDLEYVRDLGLIAQDDPPRIANPLYREVVPREITYPVQATITHDPQWFVGSDGSIDFSKLMVEFQRFFREHSESWSQLYDYREAGPQLLLQAFLQRIVNGGGRIEREYAVGNMRTDLLVIWPLSDGKVQRVVVECKILRGALDSAIQTGMEQTWEYMDRCGTESGHLVIFDRDANKSWDDRIYNVSKSFRNVSITVWGS